MTIISTEDKAAIEKKFEGLKDPVTILFHKPEGKAEQFDEFMSVLEELSAISELLSMKDMVEMETDEDMIHDVDMFPAMVLLDKDDNHHGIRFYGVPTGKLFDSFVDCILLLSNGEHGLDEDSIEKIKALDENRLMVLCTPSVPDLERYLSDTMRMAFISDKVECGVVDLVQFPEMAENYHVLDMPKTISNDDLKFTGIYSLGETMEILTKKIADAEG